MNIMNLFNISIIYQSGLALAEAAKRFIHYRFGDYDHGPYSAEAQFAQDGLVEERARQQEIVDMAFYSAKGVLYGLSTYNLITNNPNPVDVVVACAAIVESCGYSLKPGRRAI